MAAASGAACRDSRKGRSANRCGQFGKYLQVLLGRLLRHQQHEKHADRTSVGRIEGNRRSEAHEGAGRLLQALDATVRYGDALAETGGAELLAGKEAVEDNGTGQAEPRLEQHADVFENPLLAAGIQVEQNLLGREKVVQGIHGGYQ